MTRAILALAAGACLALAPAAGAATSFELGTGSNPDVAVDSAGTAHIVVDLPDERLRYCQVPRGKTACTLERTLTPPAEAVGRSSYVFLPSPGRVVIATHRCCTPDATLAYQSADNGGSFAGPAQIGDLDAVDAVYGPGDAVSGVDTGGRYQRMPLSGPPATQQALLDPGFSVPTGSSLALFDGTKPFKVSADGDSTSFSLHSGAGDPNDASTWSGPVPVTPPGGEPHVAAGSAGTAMIYRVGSGSAARLHARRFDGGGFGPAATLSSGDPIQADLTTDGSGRFTALWLENAASPNEIRVATSGDGTTWSRPTAILRGADVDDLYRSQVAVAPDGEGFAVFDANREGGSITVTPLEPLRGTTTDPPTATAVVNDQEVSFFGPTACVQPPERVVLRVTSKRKRKLSPNRRVKITRVVFSVDRKKVTDKRKAFRASFSTAAMPRGSFHRVRAVVTLAPVKRGAFKNKKKTLRGSFNVCG